MNIPELHFDLSSQDDSTRIAIVDLMNKRILKLESEIGYLKNYIIILSTFHNQLCMKLSDEIDIVSPIDSIIESYNSWKNKLPF